MFIYVTEQARAQDLSQAVFQVRQQLQQTEQTLAAKGKEVESLQQRMTASQQTSLKENASLREQLGRADQEIKQLKAAPKQQPAQ